jgi:sec-independent protein translocase protein TatA
LRWFYPSNKMFFAKGGIENGPQGTTSAVSSRIQRGFSARTPTERSQWALCDNSGSEGDNRFPAGASTRWNSGDIMFDNLFTPSHLIIILVIALLIFGPRKLPELGKGLGEGLKGFKEAIKGNPDPAKQETVVKSETVPPAAPPPAKIG